MKYIYVPLLFLSVLFAGLSCQRAEKSYPSAMQRAISLLSARPDSALYYLSQLDSQMADEPEETRVYHRLLTLAAEDKLYVPHTSDSLIREIVRYCHRLLSPGTGSRQAYPVFRPAYFHLQPAGHSVGLSGCVR